jgi:hypothetical protein
VRALQQIQPLIRGAQLQANLCQQGCHALTLHKSKKFILWLGLIICGYWHESARGPAASAIPCSRKARIWLSTRGSLTHVQRTCRFARVVVPPLAISMSGVAKLTTLHSCCVLHKAWPAAACSLHEPSHKPGGMLCMCIL